jgi:peptidoglycan-associated lipoprotein
MTVSKIFAAAAAGLALSACLGGCATVRNARDRIVRPQARCQDVKVQIYFEPGSAEVTREGRAVLRAAAGQAKGCTVDEVSVLGLADSRGGPDASLELSRKRVASVTDALAATGLPAAQMDLHAAGQEGAVTTRGTAPLRRRADVVLKLSPPKS